MEAVFLCLSWGGLTGISPQLHNRNRTCLHSRILSLKNLYRRLQSSTCRPWRDQEESTWDQKALQLVIILSSCLSSVELPVKRRQQPIQQERPEDEDKEHNRPVIPTPWSCVLKARSQPEKTTNWLNSLFDRTPLRPLHCFSLIMPAYKVFLLLATTRLTAEQE